MKNKLINILNTALDNLDLPKENVAFQIPKNPSHGDFTTNYPMINSKLVAKPPIDIAKQIVDEIKGQKNILIDSIEYIPPGFINVKINKLSFSNELVNITKADKDYGKNIHGNKKEALVEFVSANPTGPLTIGHGRNAILGDVVSRILEWNGYSVQREYYFNNAGRQMRVLGESVYSRYMEICGYKSEIPEGGYEGEYIIEIAKSIKQKHKEQLVNDKNNSIFKDTAEAFIFNRIKKTLDKIGLVFDTYFNENILYENNAINDVVDDLRSKNLAYDKDGATWFKGSSLGRDVDRVIIKSSGEPTYRLPDIAYHKDKFLRGYDLMIDVFGADHMDAYPDVLVALEALGHKSDKVKVLIHQFVTILKDGKPVKMSTRKANFISLDQLIDDVSADVTRFFFIMRSMNTHLNFDIDLAKEQSDANPVFYIQYAHARCCNILNRFNEKLDSSTLDNLSNELEIQLISKLIEFPETIKKSMVTLEPQNISNYLNELASMFHSYYAKERVFNPEDMNLSKARLYLVNSTRIVIRNGLSILGITSPEKM